MVHRPIRYRKDVRLYMIKTIELFAGVGGFRIGLERTGYFNVIWGNQWEPSKKMQDAFNCYAERFKGKGIHVNEDIAQVSEEDLRDFAADLIVGGFPCQDYSVARSLSGEQGIHGKKGVLFWEIKRLIEIKNPKYVLLENVDRLLKSPSIQRGRDFSVMLATFRDLNYSVEWRVINAAEYGQAQRRRRIFIFAYRNDTAYAGMQKNESNYNLLHNNGFFAPSFPVMSEPSKKHSTMQYELPIDIVEISDRFSATYRNSGIMRNGHIYTTELIPIEENAIPLKDILEVEVDQKYYLSEAAIEKFQYLKGPKKIERTAANGHKYVFSEGGMAFPEPLDKPGRTMLTSEGTINRSTHVVQDEKGYRFLTPVECERLNGFPDNWTNTGMSDRMRYFCMGNALVVGLIERMGRRLHDINNIVGEQMELELEEMA
jgi:DNA (cytosine-5)-methyltransferase 1